MGKHTTKPCCHIERVCVSHCLGQSRDCTPWASCRTGHVIV